MRGALELRRFAIAAMQLRAAITEIFAADIGLEEKRSLACHAVRVSLGVPSEKRQPHGKEIAYLEEALMAISEVSEFDGKISIGRAKQWLRSRGVHGALLASRVSRLSKARNALAHPDCALIRDIKAVAAGVTSSTEDADDSGVSCGGIGSSTFQEVDSVYLEKQARESTQGDSQADHASLFLVECATTTDCDSDVSDRKTSLVKKTASVASGAANFESLG